MIGASGLSLVTEPVFTHILADTVWGYAGPHRLCLQEQPLHTLHRTLQVSKCCVRRKLLAWRIVTHRVAIYLPLSEELQDGSKPL